MDWCSLSESNAKKKYTSQKQGDSVTVVNNNDFTTELK